MDDFGDRMMDFLFANGGMEDDAKPTGLLYQEAMKAFPDEAREVDGYFEAWVWMDWCNANLPHVEPDEAEVRAFVDAGMMRFWEMLAQQQGRLGKPSKC